VRLLGDPNACLRIIVSAGKKERPLVLKPEQQTAAGILKLAQDKLKAKKMAFLRTGKGDLVDDEMLKTLKPGTKLMLSKK